MGEYSKLGYFPVRMTKFNERYTKPLYEIVKNFDYSKESQEVVNACEDIAKLTTEMLESNHFVDPYKYERKAVQNLLFISKNVDDLIRESFAIKCLNYNGGLYFRKESISLYNPKLIHSNDFKYDSPLYMRALFTDEEFSNGTIKISARTLYRR